MLPFTSVNPETWPITTRKSRFFCLFSKVIVDLSVGIRLNGNSGTQQFKKVNEPAYSNIKLKVS